MSNYKIVCVDDEIEILDFIKLSMSTQPVSVVTFNNPLQALDYIRANQKEVVLVFSDFKMSEMDGFAFREAMLAENLYIPFLMLTGFYTKEMATKSMSLNISEFIDKPCSSDQLIKAFEKYSKDRITQLEEEKTMVKDFLFETTGMLEEIESLILQLEENPKNENALNTYFRLLHTIKGTASCLGLADLAHFAHSYEDLINKVKSGDIKIHAKIIDVLLKGLDYLKTMYSCTQNEKPYPFQVEKIVSIFKIENSEQNTDETQSASQEHEVKSTQEEKIGVSLNLLSNFLELSGEITVLKNSIFKSLGKIISKYPRDPDLELLAETMSEMHKVSSLLQTEVGELKKVSMESVLKPMKRVVRDSSKVCHKKVEFSTEGEDLRVDSSLGKLFSNILVHMLRNSVDHGIESPEVRKKRGKSESGNVHLRAYEYMENIVVEVEDDGNGIDLERVKKKALEKGLYSQQELSLMSDARAYQILFESGFSTADQVTEVSGRGVGMDMVKSSVEEMRGKISIKSTLGTGSKFSISVPIPRSVLIINSLSVLCQDQMYSIPLDDVAEVILCHHNDEDKIQSIEGTKFLKHHNDLLPLIDLRHLMHADHKKAEESHSVVILRDEKFFYGAIVDAIADIEEIVVKKLSPHLASNQLFMGATFSGDGGVGLILSPQGIANMCHIRSHMKIDEKEKQEAQNIFSKEYLRFHLENDLTPYCLDLNSVFRLEVFNLNQIEYSGNKAIIKYRESTLELVLLEQRFAHDTNLKIKNYLENRESFDAIVVQKNNRYFGFLIGAIEDIGVSESQLDQSIVDNDYFKGTTFIAGKINTVIDVEKILCVSSEEKNIEQRAA